MWGKPVYVTAATGTREPRWWDPRGLEVCPRGGISVEATNSHSTYFALNLVAIRAEERLGLAVYRPGAYVQVNLA